MLGVDIMSIGQYKIIQRGLQVVSGIMEFESKRTVFIFSLVHVEWERKREKKKKKQLLQC